MNATSVARLGRHAITVAAALLAILLTGCTVPPDSFTTPASDPPASPATQTPPSVQLGLPRSEPTTLDIPTIGVHSSLVTLGLNPDQTVQVPPVTTPMQAGWYEYGPTPGEIGPAVILGHVDGNKHPGVFYRLHELSAGAEVRVTRTDGRTITFQVQRIQQTTKETFPTHTVYDDTTDAELRLITCGGAFNRTTHNYLDNIIIYATMLPR